MPDWDDYIPQWRREGRTGPNGPRYASRDDRAAVRRGQPVPGKKGVVSKIVDLFTKKGKK